MKTTLLILTATLSFIAILEANPIAREIGERALRASGIEVAQLGARESADRAAAIALQRLGREGAEELAERGGLALLEAGARHGDAVLFLAGRCPEAARYIGAKPVEALSLAGRFGDDAVRLESRVPGLASEAAGLFGPDRLGILAKAAPQEVSVLLGYAKRAADTPTREALWDLWIRRGGDVLRELDKHKALILTGGLTIGIVKVADGAADAIRETPEKVPQAVEKAAVPMGAGVAVALVILALGQLRRFRFRQTLHPPHCKRS